MSYEITSDTVINFISNKNVKLPRFQRKQTWKDDKNFKLCISLFKKFPIGVCIFSIDESKNGRTTRWLLDGRQRRNALSLLNEDPENVYVWAMKFIKFKASDQPNEVKNKFKEKISEFLEEDDELLKPATQNYSEEDNDGAEVDDYMELAEEEEVEINDSEQVNIDDENLYGLNLLLDIILATHNKTRKSSGFTRPFDFSKFVDRLPYVEADGSLSSKKLKSFLKAYSDYCYNNGLEEEEKDSFIQYVSQFGVNNDVKLKTLVHNNWDDIQHRIDLLQRLEDLLLNCRIGYIEVKNLSQSESKKIFTLLNTEGAQLNMVEVLSAKTKWTVPVAVLNEETLDLVHRLYKEQIGTTVENVVKWDLPAIFMQKIGKNFIFKEAKFNKAKPDEYDKPLTMGFKVMAGIYADGVKKENIELLSNKTLGDYEEKITQIKQMLKVIASFDYFKYFNTWRVSLVDLTADFCAMNFFIVAYKKYKSMDCPVGGTEAKNFQKFCFMLWDRMIFESITGQWSSTGDAKIKRYIDGIDSITPVTTDQWNGLLNEIFTKSSINEKPIKNQGELKSLLYHMYCLMYISAPDPITYPNLDIDHILPQDKFKSSSIDNKLSVMHNILNLGILPKGDNIKKSNFVLSQIVESFVKDLIEKYEFIKPDQYVDFSNISNYQAMFDYRKSIISNAFNIKRTDILNN